MRTWKKTLCSVLAAVGLATAADAQVVISQVYGGGGGAGAVYTNDFVELFNKGNAAVDMSGWILDYSGATGAWGASNEFAFPPGTTIPANAYFLVQLQGGANGAALPTPDLTSAAINMAGANGKIALLSGPPSLAGICPLPAANLVDLLGYGTANCSIGSAASAASGTTGLIRNDSGCAATGSNQTDFSVGTPSARNSSSTFVCTPTTSPSGVGSVSPSPACPSSTVTFTVTVTPGTFPPSTTLGVTGNFVSLGLSTETFTAGPGNTFTFTTTLANAGPGNYIVPVTITDGQGRMGTTQITLPVSSCFPSITSGTGASPSGVCTGSSTTLTVVVSPGLEPASTGIAVFGDLQAIGGSATQAFTEGPANTFTFNAAVPLSTPAGPVVLPITVTDAQARGDTGTLNLIVSPCTSAASTVVISQVYGGGGNTGATLINDFIELFNRGTTPVNITGWSVQYASASDANGGFGSGMNPATNVPTLLSGTIQPGQYYLVQQAAGAGGTQPLPTPDATGPLTLGGTAGRIALVRNGDPVLTDCADPDIADLVGYGEGGSAPVCNEGGAIGPTETLNNDTAAIRNQNGCQDTDQNRIDFTEATPTPRNTASPFILCGGAASGACCPNAGPCFIATAANCGLANGTFQGNGSVCTPDPCSVVVTGACCCGSTCSITTAAACTGANQSFAGAGTVCNAFGGNATTPCCLSDYNQSGGAATVQDIFDFLSGYFSSDACADINGGGVSVQDIFDFLSSYFAGGCL